MNKSKKSVSKKSGQAQQAQFHQKTPVIPHFPAISQKMGEASGWPAEGRVGAKIKNEKTNPSNRNYLAPKWI